jgi:hypothetical protein
MILLILAGLVYTIWAESIPASILTAALILYRAQRPGRMMQRVREAWYQRQAAQVGVEEAE